MKLKKELRVRAVTITLKQSIIANRCRILRNLKCAYADSKDIYMRGTYRMVYEGWVAVKLNREDIGVRPFIRLWEFGGTRRRERRGSAGVRLHDQGPPNVH